MTLNLKRAQIFNWLLVIALALIVSLWSFIRFGEPDVNEEDFWTVSDANFQWESVQSSSVTVQRNARDAALLLSDSEAVFSWDEELNIDFLSGSLLVANSAYDFSASILTDWARFETEGGLVYVTQGETQLQVYAFDHPTLVTFLLEGEELNQIMIPAGFRMNIPYSKITETIGKLRLTKLSKEFPVFTFKEADFEEEVLTALNGVQADYANAELKTLSAYQAARDFGPAFNGKFSLIDQASTWFQSAITVLPAAQDRFEEENREEMLSYARSHLLAQNEAQAQLWIEAWAKDGPEIEELEKHFSDLSWVLPGDELYLMKAKVTQLLFEKEAPLDFLRVRLNEIESLLAAGDTVQAQSSYALYREKFQDLLAQGVFDEEEWLDEISRETVLLELLLRSHSSYYSIEALSLLSDLEEKILILSGDGQDVDEERQAFVQSKIRFLANLFSFVEQRKISVGTATDLASELVRSAKSQLNSIVTPAAVTEYFAGQVDTYDLMTDFINAPEFYSYKDFDEGFEVYQAKVEDLDELNDYIQDLRSGNQDTLVSFTLDEAISEVAEDLLLGGVQYSGLDWQGDSQFRLFEIQGARTGGYGFDAFYDRESGLLYDVEFGDIRYSTGLLLENALEVFELSLENLDVDLDGENNGEETDGEIIGSDSLSLTESVAIQSAEDAFSSVGLRADDFEFEVVDLDANLFVFEGSITAFGLPVSGTFDLLSLKVSEVVWDYDGVGRTLPSVGLSQLEAAIDATVTALRSVE
jgi:hypothetical protein